MESAVIRFERAVACAEMIDDEGRRRVEVDRAQAELKRARWEARQRGLAEAVRLEARSRTMIATLSADWTGRDLTLPIIVDFDWDVRCPLALAVLAGALERVDGLIVGAGLARSTFALTALGRLLVRRYRYSRRDVA